MNNPPKEHCPSLGSEEDRQKHLDYPTPQHRCYADDEGQHVSNVEQVRLCLDRRYRECPRFLASRRPAAPPSIPARPRNPWPLVFGALALATLFAAGALLLYAGRGWAVGTVSASNALGGQPVALEPTSTSTFTPSPTPSATPTPTVTPTPTPSPSPTHVAASAPPDRILAPAIGLDSPVVPVGWHLENQSGQVISVWEVADFAAGWHKNSTYPGQGGNVVISGHHNIKGEIFRYLVDLKPGDPITVYVGSLSFGYAVEKVMILKDKGLTLAEREQNGVWIKPTPYEQLTLVTCWPYADNTHRLIVVARPLPAQ